MARHWMGEDGAIHCEGPDGSDFFLCGFAPEGENGGHVPTPTPNKIDCERCSKIITFSKQVRYSEID